jgi:purine nucleosidase
MSHVPILLDTDPGSDIDDAIALAYLLNQPDCDLLGVTTVSGDVVERAAIIDVLCRLAGRTDVPIVCGTSNPILNGPGQPICPHYESIKHLPHSMDRKPNQAVSFLREKIRSRPHEITLLTVGPLTNIALLFLIDPEIPSLLKNIYSMAGAFWRNDNHEWNTDCDCSASGIVSRIERPDHYWFGLDVTTQCSLTREEVCQKFQGPLLETIMLMANVFFTHSDRITFHDPLAATCVFNQDICKFIQGKVSVEPTNGECSFESGNGSDRVASTVDSSLFFNEFFRRFRSTST